MLIDLDSRNGEAIISGSVEIHQFVSTTRISKSQPNFFIKPFYNQKSGRWEQNSNNLHFSLVIEILFYFLFSFFTTIGFFCCEFFIAIFLLQTLIFS
jgi:hypothetical protein